MDDFIKFILVVVLIGAIVAGLAYLSSNFTNWDITTWFNAKAMSESMSLLSGNFALFCK